MPNWLPIRYLLITITTEKKRAYVWVCAWVCVAVCVADQGNDEVCSKKIGGVSGKGAKGTEREIKKINSE